MTVITIAARPAGTSAKGKLPANYRAAKTALAECDRIDECQGWADKMEALASYAKQQNDQSLLEMARRIQARAARRVGELLNEIEPQKGGDRGNAATGGRPPVARTRTQAATDAGLSAHQRKQALRLANVPKEEFEQAVESDKPPTVTALAQQGRKFPRTTYPGKRVRAAIIELDRLISGLDSCTSDFRRTLAKCKPEQRELLLHVIPRLTKFLTGFKDHLEALDGDGDPPPDMAPVED